VVSSPALVEKVAVRDLNALAVMDDKDLIAFS
jgi:hypothetical protein